MPTKYFCFDKNYELTVVERVIDIPRTAEQVVTVDEDRDTLGVMLHLQLLFQLRLGTLPAVETQDRTDFIAKHAQYANAELHEMLRELEGFKAWKTYNWTEEEQEQHLQNAREELIDALHFICNIAVALRLSSTDILYLYAKKNEINHTRQDNGY